MIRVLHKKNHLRKVSCHLVTICGTVFLFPSGRSGGLIDRVLDSSSRGLGSRPCSWAKHSTLTVASVDPGV